MVQGTFDFVTVSLRWRNEKQEVWRSNSPAILYRGRVIHAITRLESQAIKTAKEFAGFWITVRFRFSLSFNRSSKATGRKDINVMQATSVAVLTLLKLMYFQAI